MAPYSGGRHRSDGMEASHQSRRPGRMPGPRQRTVPRRLA